MGSVLHGCARTTPRLRAELQASKESTRTLAARYGLNPKTVAKWRKRRGGGAACGGRRIGRPREGLTVNSEDVVGIERPGREAAAAINALLAVDADAQQETPST